VQVPNKLEDCELLPDITVNDEGELLHVELLVNAEPLNNKNSLNSSLSKKSMLDELRAI
jgi:hypothetical protein